MIAQWVKGPATKSEHLSSNAHNPAPRKKDVGNRGCPIASTYVL